MSSKFHLIEDIRFFEDVLSILVVDLNQGEPDGFVGLPLEVTSDSYRHLIKFDAIAGFQSVPEPLNGLTESAIKLDDFLYLDPESSYMSELKKDGATFIYGANIPKDPKLDHYVIYGENTVVHVLSAAYPTTVSPFKPA